VTPETRIEAYRRVVRELERIIHARTPGFIRPKPLTHHEVLFIAELLTRCHDDKE
jgi:hypothetical protein